MALLRELLRGRALRWIVLAFFWLVIGVLSALHWQLFFTGRDPYSWWELYRVKVALWYVWGLLTPLILWLGWKYPIGQGRSLRHIAILLPVSLAFTAVYLVIYSAFLMLNVPDAPGLFQSPTAMFMWVVGAHSTWYFLAFWATIGVEHAVSYYRRFHERQVMTSKLQAQLAEAQLDTLRSQLQPHFLFNTLHSIMALINQSDTKAAKEMLAGLSDLLRHALEHVRRHEVPLREELDILRRYIEIERVRFSDRLTVEWEIDNTADAAYVPSFILQPLAENAIRHGIEKRSGPGVLSVHCWRDNGRLLLTFTDNGVGLPPTRDDAVRNGHGLGDMRSRLDVLYPSDYSLEISDANAGGTVVRLSLPYNERPTHQPTV
jgi:two-component sensor histidine kinase